MNPLLMTKNKVYMKKIFIMTLIGILSLNVSNAQTNSGKLKIFNGKVITPYSIIENACVLIENGKIVDVRTDNVEFSGAKVILSRIYRYTLSRRWWA